MKFVILDNTAWTTHFDALQSISRVAETASATSRRASERLVRWTPPSSSRHPSLPPSSLYVRADVYDDTLRAPLQIFFASSGDTRSADANTQRAATHELSRALSQSVGRNDDARMSRASCAAKWGEIRGEIPGSVTAKRCASRANQNVSQSSAPAATGAGAAAAAAGLRAGAARFGAASRSLRATAGAGGETGTAAAAGTARGA